jgi:hypothetical protein
MTQAVPHPAQSSLTRARSIAFSLIIATTLATKTAGAEGEASKWPAVLGEPGAAVPRDPSSRTPGPSGQLSNITIDDADPASSVPPLEELRKDPIEFAYLLMDLSAVADKAFAAKDFPRAARYYLAICKAAPEKAVGYRKLCASHAETGNLDGALDACRVALTRDGSQTLDHERFLRLLLRREGALSPAEVEEADRVFAHLGEQGVTDSVFTTLKCDFALRLEDERRLRECTTALAATAPDDPKTLTYQWSLAMLNKDAAAARGVIDRAKLVGVQPAAIARMGASTDAMASKTRTQRVLIGAGILALVAVFGALLVVLSRKLRTSAPAVPGQI